MSEVGTTTICSADALTDTYALMDDDLQVQDGTNKWFWLYGETQTSLEVTYTTGAAETNNYVLFYVEYGSGSVTGAPNRVSTMTWVPETVEYLDDSANQIILEPWVYRIDGAAAGTAYSLRIPLPVCTKAIRIYAKEVGVAANYGTLTIKANTQAAGANHYNRSLQTVTLEASGITIGDVRITDGTTVCDCNATWAETIALAGNSLNVAAGIYGVDADAGSPIMRALQVAVDNATVSATPNVLVAGGIYKNALDTYNDNDAVPLHFGVGGLLLVDVNGLGGSVAHDAADAGNPVKIGGKASSAKPAAVSNADRVDAYFDIYGRQHTYDEGGGGVSGGGYSTYCFTPTNSFGHGTSAYGSGTTFTVSGHNFTPEAVALVKVDRFSSAGVFQETLSPSQATITAATTAGVTTYTYSAGSFSAGDLFVVYQGGPERTTNLAADAQNTLLQNPDSQTFVGETLAALSNITQSTTGYLYLDMAGYRYFTLQGETSDATPTDVLTCTVEATTMDDGTAAASCTYQDVTNELFGVESWVDTDFMAICDIPTGFKYVRLKYTTSAGGGNDCDLSVYAKRFY